MSWVPTALARTVRRAERVACAAVPEIGLSSNEASRAAADKLAAHLRDEDGNARVDNATAFQLLSYLEALTALDRRDHHQAVVGLFPIAAARYVERGFASGNGRPDPLLANALYLFGREYLRYAQWSLSGEFFYHAFTTTEKPELASRNATLALICLFNSDDRETYRTLRSQMDEAAETNEALRRVMTAMDIIQLGDQLPSDLEWFEPLWSFGRLAGSLITERAVMALNDAGRYQEALVHCDITQEILADTPSEHWIHAAIRQQRARALHGAGAAEEALSEALAAWDLSEDLRYGSCDHPLRESMWARYLTARQIALDCAVRKGEPDLVAAFIEKDRLRASLAATIETVTSPDPATQVEVTSSERPGEVSAPGPSESTAPAAFFLALEDAMNATTLVPPPPSAGGRRFQDSVPWWLGISRYGSSVYWSVFQHGVPLECGAIDLVDDHSLNDVLLGIDADVGAFAFGATSDGAPPNFDPIHHLAEWGTAEERIASLSLGRLLPPSLVTALTAASAEQPVELVIAAGSGLSGVPWPVVQVGGADRGGFRLIERARIRHSISQQVDERRATQPPNAPLELLVAVDDPQGDLSGSSAFLTSNARRYFGAASTPSRDAKAALRAALHEECVGHPPGIFYYRGHAHSWSDPARACLDLPKSLDPGEDSLAVYAGEFFGRFEDGSAYLPLPSRVVLSCCSSAGRSLFGGEAVGLAAACILGGGAREVVATGYDIPDSSFATAFDDLLAEAMTSPLPHDLALRRLQLRMYDEWRIFSVRGGVTSDEDITHPNPMVWAMYQAI
ncbi:CHAT domain-containing protein [Micromonospora sp. CV4]|uniref:CHAT domain-containing protein n=1 Tax=Micromonospora sp. CV4 TaxID=2478711 RepID=UPI000EF53D38|nr:CHAT domain-containing protein [Micromonospora sp. CV4]RLP95562.1 CHAT domain-containing protein [Micromonospora sp. CV4]